MQRVLTVALVLLVACGSTPRRPTSATPGLGVVPLGESRVLVFSQRGVERLDGTVRTTVEAALPGAAPIACANDPHSGWSALAYPGAIVVVNTSEERIKRVDDVAWTSPPTALGIGGTTIGTIEDGTIALYDALGGKRLWKDDGQKRITALGLESIEYVMPISPERMLVVAFKSMSAFSNPEAMVVDIDRSSGVPTAQERPFGGELHWLEACAGDGRNLYVAGTNQVVENVGVQQRQMTKTVVVLRHDPVRGRNQVVVRARQQPGTEVRVKALAAGHGLLACAFDDGRVTVYDAGGEREAAYLWGEPVLGLDAITCVDPDHVAFVVGGEVRIERVRRGATDSHSPR